MKDCWVVWLNRGLMVLTALLMLSAIITLITVIVSYNGGKMDLGNAADWVSAIANLGVVFFAGYAALNAKNWLGDKKNVSSYNHASNIIADLIALYNKMDMHITIYSTISISPFDLSQCRLRETEQHSIFDSALTLSHSYELIEFYGFNTNNEEIKKVIDNIMFTARFLATHNLYHQIKLTTVIDDFKSLRIKINEIATTPIDELFKFN
ncbi:hypothetical protein [Edwardsiella tarda]|uniref:hypothetical protein n=1 Tax=Edwardsiella tarda TaxID=636 RepID=UPI00351C258D